METAPNVEIVYQCICTLFHNSNPKEKDKANKWLEDFQKSFYSWTIADELLQQKRDLHSCYFAAQTMRSKIQNSFNELPPHSHDSLRDSLIVHVSQTAGDSDQIIVTQLCLAVADLALLMASWKDPVKDLLETLSPHPKMIWALLEILTLIPEEIDSRLLRLGSNRRKEIHKQLETVAPKVLDYLNICIATATKTEPADERLLNGTLKCYTTWVESQAVPIENFMKNPIAQQVFNLLSHVETTQKLHDTATDCICSVLSGTDHQRGVSDNMHMLKAHIFNAVFTLENMYHMSVAQEEIDKAINYCRVFTVMCESFLHEMVTNVDSPHYSIKGLDLVLICVGHFDYEVAEITFHLWYRLSEELFQRNNQKLTDYFKPHIERLLGALYRHAQMDPDQEGILEDSDSFSDFRKKVSDLIKDVAFIVGSGACFKQMYITLQAPNTSWESTEAALFVMQNVAKCIVPSLCLPSVNSSENEVIPKVVQAILSLPENTHIAVRYTSIMLLGELCDWIENHPESLQAVLNFLLYSLQQKNVAAAAAMSLTSICAACRQTMTVHIRGLIDITRSLESFEIVNDLAIGLLKSISIIISRLPRAELETSMREIISFQLQPLAELVNSDNTVSLDNKAKDTPVDPVYWIDRVCAVIRHTNPDVAENEIHPTLSILTEAWPLISRVIDKYQTEMRVMERTCRLIRYGVRSVRKQASILAEPLLKQMVCVYAIHHHSCFLYLGSVLVDELAFVDDCIPNLLEMLKAFIEPTFSMLQVENGLKNNPDTVDDFFRLCSRFIECCPIQFLQSALVTPIFQCALLACTLDHREANKSVMQFFANLLKWGHTTNQRFTQCGPLVLDIALQNGEALMINLLNASIFSLHTYMLPDVAEVINELKLVLPAERMTIFLKCALDSLPKKNAGGYVAVTQQQLVEFSNDVLTADSTKSISQALKTFTRLFR